MTLREEVRGKFFKPQPSNEVVLKLAPWNSELKSIGGVVGERKNSMRQGSSKSFVPQGERSSNGGYFMEPIHLFEKAEFSKENFLPKQLHIGEAGAAVLICFEPGQTMPLHPHPGAVEVILYGVEGEGTLAIGDEEKPFKKGDLIFCKGETPIGPKNTGHGKFMVLVILVLKKLIEKQ